MKAVFIIDVDKDELGKAIATITAKENDITFIAEGIIRPLPDKWQEDGNTSFIAKGWNACLEEITNG